MCKDNEVMMEITLPRIVINVELVGTNSLLGSLCRYFLENHPDCLKNIGVLNPEEIVFIIEKVAEDIDLHYEIRKVRDAFKIKENKIVVNIES